jgi:hypothetical protein
MTRPVGLTVCALMLLAPPLAAADCPQWRASGFGAGYSSLAVGDQGVDAWFEGDEIAEGLHEQDKGGLREICVYQLCTVMHGHALIATGARVAG